jgi:hypothetical protein
MVNKWVLPNLRKYGKYEVNKKLKQKLRSHWPSWDIWSQKNLNKKIKLLEKNKDSLEKQNDILKKIWLKINILKVCIFIYTRRW